MIHVIVEDSYKLINIIEVMSGEKSIFCVLFSDLEITVIDKEYNGRGI